MHQAQNQVVWPSDTHAGAELANLLTVTDDGYGIYVTFGHFPPDPAPRTSAADVVPRVVSSVYISHANALLLANVLKRISGGMRTEEP